MSGGYKQQPGSGGNNTRKDGKRVAGKQSFPPPGSGGSRPKMAERDLQYIPEMVGGRENNQPVRMSTIEQEPVQRLVNLQNWLIPMQKLQDKHGMGMM